MRGYTLIELLIVMVIMSIIGVTGYVNYKQYSSRQVTSKALGQVQTLLRLAQSNATSSTFCNDNTNTGPWSLVFNQNQTSIDLVCGTSRKTYTLENARIDTIVGSGCGGSSVIPLTVIYSNGVGAMTFVSQGAFLTCLASDTWTFTISNTKNTGTPSKSFSISKGGAINVE